MKNGLCRLDHDYQPEPAARGMGNKKAALFGDKGSEPVAKEKLEDLDTESW